ncbi:VOC family protein [Pseudovibrio exalbescens]|uniref:VOC family protein n=1 Tax=Pseudovibrio exalbescens TaxID=197461 RepID=UPI001AD8E259|nr:VOC family protein [Pseudovibrio exalbescens]
MIGTTMTQGLSGLGVLFVAGFGPITRNTEESRTLYADALGLPLKPYGDTADYFLTEDGELEGCRHFALWPLAQAAQSCFGRDEWPAELPVPQAWLEFDVKDIIIATERLKARGYHLLIANREEPWGQKVTRFLSPEGLLVAVSETPWLRTD